MYDELHVADIQILNGKCEYMSFILFEGKR